METENNLKYRNWLVGLFVLVGIVLFARYLSFGRYLSGSLILVQYLLFSALLGVGFGKYWRDMTKKEKVAKSLLAILFLILAGLQYYYAS